MTLLKLNVSGSVSAGRMADNTYPTRSVESSGVSSGSDEAFPCISWSVKHLEGQGELPAADKQAEAADRFTPASFKRSACSLTNVALDRVMDVLDEEIVGHIGGCLDGWLY
jgi:hypothetical protein